MFAALNTQSISLGGGCYWCTEAVFQNLRGVSLVTQGFACSNPPDDRPSEAIQIIYDPLTISLSDLIEIHLRTHASTSQHSMRYKYRSAIYVHNEYKLHKVKRLLTRIQGKFSHDLITKVLPLVKFDKSDQKYQNYYLNNRNNQFCHRYIDPKLETLRCDFAHLMSEPG